ncbi:MAG: division/cell wall cluster transcriptional repressor MraZ [Rhodospirillaceae bacterium]|nr:division/cell wall cluster transcriptional repressor MraZ [Rhodospirillaceae bacterium]
MKSFIGTFINKIDAKGRISVPAPFRAVLQAKSLSGVTCYPALTGPCIEGCGLDRIEAMVETLPDEPIPGVEEDVIAHLIFASARDLPFDGGGRIVLPADFLKKADLTGQGAFVGKGRTFQIWNPSALETAQAEMFERAMAERESLLRARKEAD